MRIKSKYYNLNKEFESGYGFGQPTHSASYYYDDLWIGLELLDVDISNQSRNGCNEVSIHINKFGDGRIATKLTIPYYYDMILFVQEMVLQKFHHLKI